MVKVHPAVEVATPAMKAECWQPRAAAMMGCPLSGSKSYGQAPIVSHPNSEAVKPPIYKQPFGVFGHDTHL